MYNSQYCEVEYNEKYNVAFIKWKQFCSHDDYRGNRFFMLLKL